MGFNSAFKGLNAELNPICHLLALLEANHILHVSRIRVKGYSYTGATTDTTQQSGQTQEKEVEINHVTVLCQRLHGNRPVWHVVFQQLLASPTSLLVSSRESGMLSSNNYWLAQQICLCRAESLACCLLTTTDWPNKFACFEPRVWPHTCCSLHRIRILMQWTNRI